MNALDIETIPNDSMVDSLPEPEVAIGNMVDQKKIEAKRKEVKAKQKEKMALDPFYGRICSFSIHGESQSFFKVIPEISEAAEIELVTELLEYLSVGSNEKPNLIVTWNGHRFDLPYIYKRAALLKIALPRSCPGLNYWRRKYKSEPHCDLMQELSGWDISQTENLDEAGKRFLGRGKTQRDYSTYVDLIKSGEGDKIGLDNLCDTELTYDLYKLLSPYLF